MKIRFIHKILLLLLLPVLGITMLLGDTLIDRYHDAAALNKLELEVELTTYNSALVHELQKERGATSGWLGAGTEAFANTLRQQRQQTDQVMSRWQNYLEGQTFSDADITSTLVRIQRELGQLRTIRQSADNRDIELSRALGYFTDLIAELLSVSATASRISDDAAISRASAAFYAYLQAKERAGIERAVLSNVFGRDSFAPGLYERFLNLVSQQETYLAQFKVLATEEQGSRFSQLDSSAEFSAVERLRKVAMDKATSGNFGVPGTEWFDRATDRINVMKSFEDQIAGELLNTAANQHQQALFQTWLAGSALAGILALVALISSWIIRGLHRQVDALANTMDRVRNEHDLTARAAVLSGDELGTVAHYLNHTLDNFSSAIREVATASTQLNQEALSTSSIVQQAEQSLQSQSNETMQVAAAVEEVSTAVQDVANSTVSASDAAHQANQLAMDGHAKVQAAVAAVASLASDSQRLAEMTARLNESSQRISDVTNVINNVSEQTNLLALNAAIEAARAGEHGRGFAVVADEVRTLAQRTQQSTSEIDEIIRRLQHETQQANTLVESNQKDMELATSRAREVEQALDQIVIAIGDITNMSTQIAAAAEEESTAISDIGRNITGIDNSAETISESARVLSEHAEQQLQLAQNLSQLIKRFKT
jgi:methyl-accepting chemotaxis protein